MEIIPMIPEQYTYLNSIPKHRPHVCAILQELLTSKALRVGLFTVNHVSIAGTII